MIDKIAQHYTELYEIYGDSAQACQYGSEESQIFRFKQLIQVADLHGANILDLGCGRGSMYGYLEKMAISTSYTGIDLVEGTLSLARQRFSQARFIKRDILCEPLDESFDYVFLNIVFNNRFDEADCEHDDYMYTLLKAAFQHCTKGMAFNFISTYVNFVDDEMAYHDPTQVLKFCIEQLSRKVYMMHHYERCDVAVFVYK